MRLFRRRDKYCAHSNLIGIYGDAIYYVPGYRRLICKDCGQALDGPVTLAEDRTC